MGLGFEKKKSNGRRKKKWKLLLLWDKDEKTQEAEKRISFMILEEYTHLQFMRH